MYSKQLKKLYKTQIKFALEFLKIKNPPTFKTRILGTSESGCYNFETQTVIINKNPCYSGNISETLFHELVHHKQWEEGWLKIQQINNDTIYFWKKKKTKGKGYKLDNYKSYYNSPHEIQARDLSKRMLEVFNNNCN